MGPEREPLIRQVLINLIKNAVQAIGGEKGRIHVRAYSSADEHFFEQKYPETVKKIDEGKVLTDDIAKEIQEAIEAYLK